MRYKFGNFPLPSDKCFCFLLYRGLEGHFPVLPLAASGGCTYSSPTGEFTYSYHPSQEQKGGYDIKPMFWDNLSGSASADRRRSKQVATCISMVRVFSAREQASSADPPSSGPRLFPMARGYWGPWTLRYEATRRRLSACRGCAGPSCATDLFSSP